MLRVQRHPHRTGERHLVALNFQRLRQHLDHPVGQAGAIGHVRDILRQQHELVTADAGHRVAVPRGRAQPTGSLLQHLVTHRVAQHVVDRLEAVQVHEQHGQLARLAPRAAVVVTVVALHRVQQPILEEHAIGQPGQRIDEGASAQFLIGRFQLQVGLRERLSPPPEKEQQRHMRDEDDDQHQSHHHAGKMEIRQEFQDGAHPEKGCRCGGAMPALHTDRPEHKGIISGPAQPSACRHPMPTGGVPARASPRIERSSNPTTKGRICPPKPARQID